ncbi:glutamate--cysteine ligase [Xylophilus rhododendri]|uniref:Glutamate--cysteine ligase n=1 Tax=Xylophilus rhododendri TaxID=2697032 RepID=A0A857J4S7_9BURK|nr:glutamate--cysteine ligase [Xylophilus rhododendri]QHI98687.1 glutamate--cysteine ligase [Xylophilus rhododendri]
MVPHLITALNGPINELEQRILDSTPAIERWFRLEWMEHTPPFYSSVDVRNAGFKLAPVDTNLFPGGWNRLSPQMQPLAVQAAMAAIEKICPEARNLLLIPENHGDPDYLENVAQLSRIFHAAGLNVRVGSVDPEIKDVTMLTLASGEQLRLEPVVRNGGRLATRHFDPCTILLNNDLSQGAPGILEELHEQYLLPPLHAGWSVRRKSRHFQSYEEVSKRFGKMLGIDPWLVNPLFENAGEVDFASGRGMEALAQSVNTLLTRVRRKYKEYGINEKAFAVVKTDNGTGGIGVMTVHDARDLESLSERARQKMSSGKDGQTVHDIIVQEGVPTYEHVGKANAEPVVYMMDRYVVGGFYRVHGERGADENLSGPGASAVPLDYDDSARLTAPGAKGSAEAPNRFYMYGVIGRLAMLSASYELEATNPEAEAYD